MGRRLSATALLATGAGLVVVTGVSVAVDRDTGGSTAATGPASGLRPAAAATTPPPPVDRVLGEARHRAHAAAVRAAEAHAAAHARAHAPHRRRLAFTGPESVPATLAVGVLLVAAGGVVTASAPAARPRSVTWASPELLRLARTAGPRPGPGAVNRLRAPAVR